MALINCPECGKEISDRAKQCPSCGFRLKKYRYPKLKIILITSCAFVFVSLIVYGAISAKNKSSSKSTDNIDVSSLTEELNNVLSQRYEGEYTVHAYYLENSGLTVSIEKNKLITNSELSSTVTNTISAIQSFASDNDLDICRVTYKGYYYSTSVVKDYLEWETKDLILGTLVDLKESKSYYNVSVDQLEEYCVSGLIQ
ncbi:MAG: zinc ribbon domain-containing protein [Clostridia bacterium]|nr:zinc ribbon domain-containing protein [Clostridia bacterium]